MAKKNQKGRNQKGKFIDGQYTDGILSDKYAIVKGLKLKGKEGEKLRSLTKREQQLVALGAIIEAEEAKDRKLHDMARRNVEFKNGVTAQKVVEYRKEKKAKKN